MRDAADGMIIDEAYREIGPGSIDSVCWAGGSVFYIDGDMLYKINVKELYTTGLYSPVIDKGTHRKFGGCPGISI